ncbi:unnamed protein product [Orchesella dallaii]|uniref:Uncharacterized protein n=1 Tax=Orchesella dallaii TaxID=48710 RepID=A0ABP1QIW7_9HEXA
MSGKRGSRKNCYDGIDFQNLRIGPKSKQGKPPAPPPRPLIMERIPCFGCVLWCPKILQEMEAHDADNESLHTTKAIGKLLSEAVIRENSNMDWRNPFLLLDIVYGKGYKVKGEKDGSIMIPVMEKTSANNANVPVNKRMWYLTVAPCCLKLGVEMLRRVPTTVMIWDVEKCPYEVVTEKSKFQGLIYLNTFLGPVNALIFHHEEISRERIRSMQGNFATSELELFSDDYRRRLINNMVLPLFAVHLSKQTPCMPKPEIQVKLDAAVIELVGESDEMDSEDEEASPNPEENANVTKKAEETASDQPKSKGKASTSKSSEPPKSQGTVDKAPDTNPTGEPVKAYTPSATFAVPAPPSALPVPLPAIPSTSAGCIPIPFDIPDDQNSQNMDDDVDFFEASDEEGKVVQPSTSRDAIATSSSKGLPSPPKSQVSDDEKVGNVSNGNMEQERRSLSQEGSGAFAATQHLAPDDSDVEVITLDSSDDEGVTASGKTTDTKENLKRANASSGSSSQEPNKTSNGKDTEEMGLEEPGPSSKGNSVIRFAKTQRLTADTSDIEVIQLDSDDDEPPASNDNGDTKIDLEQGKGTRNLKGDEDDEDANA